MQCKEQVPKKWANENLDKYKIRELQGLNNSWIKGACSSKLTKIKISAILCWNRLPVLFFSAFLPNYGLQRGQWLGLGHAMPSSPQPKDAENCDLWDLNHCKCKLLSLFQYFCPHISDLSQFQIVMEGASDSRENMKTEPKIRTVWWRVLS